MPILKAFLFGLTILPFVPTINAFSGDFLLSNIFVDASASQTGDGPLNHSNYIYFEFTDQDTPQLAAVPCLVYWPSSNPNPSDDTSLCANSTFRVTIADNGATSSSFSPQNFGVGLSHTYIDNSVGQAPYNVLTKFGGLNLTWPGVDGYYCDGNGDVNEGGDGAKCWSRTGTSYLAVVTAAIS